MDLSGSDVHTESASQGEKSAKVVGGAAALGAILGRIIGGAKAPAPGQRSETGAAVMTSDEKLVFPAGTRLAFRLQSAPQNMRGI